MVATLDSLTPVPAVGFPEARSGGQLVAQAPKHVLFVPESFLKRYSVRPCESTRMFPRLLLDATSTVAVASPDVVGDFDEVLEPPPHAASETAASAAAATGVSRVMRLVRVIFTPFRGNGSYASSGTACRRKPAAGHSGSLPRRCTVELAGAPCCWPALAPRHSRSVCRGR